MDLRALGALALPLKILWAATALMVPLLAGPWPAGSISRPRWILQGFSPTWALWLLWPTYLVMACLVANTVYYFMLLHQGWADPMIPMPLLVLLLLSAWVLLTREWMRQRDRLPIATPAKRWLHLRVTMLVVPVLLFTLAALVIHIYALPPAGPVDLAVVLGGRMRADGSASNELAARVQAAIDLYQRGQVKHILLSGAIHPPAAPGMPDMNELAAMQQVCLDAGLPDSAFSLDPVGVNTTATAFNTRAFMRDHGYNSVVACSSNFHLYRTHMAFRMFGLDAYTLPAKLADWQCDDPKDTVRELIGLVVYTLDPHYRQPKGILMPMTSPRVVVRKTAGSLELFDGDALIKTYPCITGGEAGDKSVEGDRKTPIGTFRIVFKNPQSKFHLSLGLDYPNHEDADRGLASGLISRAEYDGILEALKSDLSKEENQKKLWYTKLGGEIFIHGHANGRPGTAGCVALSNPDVEELYALLPIGTTVEIRP